MDWQWIYWIFVALVMLLVARKHIRKPAALERAPDAATQAVSTLPDSEPSPAGSHEGVTMSAMTVSQGPGDPPPGSAHEPALQPPHQRKDYTAFRQALDCYGEEKFSSREKQDLFQVYLKSQHELIQLRQLAASQAHPGHTTESEAEE